MFPLTESSDQSPRRWAAHLRRALDLAVAFATLRDVDPPPGDPPTPPAGSFARSARHAATARVDTPPSARGVPVAPSVHPHHRTARVPRRSRRPGTVAAATNPCLTPLVPRARRRPRAAGRAG